MTTAPPAPVRPHDGYRHDAVLYAGLEGFLATTVPFVQDGVAAGEPVMVAVAPPRLDALREALGRDAGAVRLVDMAQVGRNPARILPAWLEFVEQHSVGGQPVRGVGEPVWAGRQPAEVAECQLHEALLNVAVSPDTPLWLRCPYDVSALDRSVLHAAEHSHALLVSDEAYVGSTSYGGLSHVTELFADELPEPTAQLEELAFAYADLDAVRGVVQARAACAGLPAATADDLTTAVYELATNSLKYAGGHGVLRSWVEPDALVFEVRDQGRIDDPLVGRRMPSLEATGGRGVWLANQLVDLVQLRSTASGTTARLTTWR